MLRSTRSCIPICLVLFAILGSVAHGSHEEEDTWSEIITDVAAQPENAAYVDVTSSAVEELDDELDYGACCCWLPTGCFGKPSCKKCPTVVGDFYFNSQRTTPNQCPTTRRCRLKDGEKIVSDTIAARKHDAKQVVLQAEVKQFGTPCWSQCGAQGPCSFCGKVVLDSEIVSTTRPLTLEVSNSPTLTLTLNPGLLL